MKRSALVLFLSAVVFLAGTSSSLASIITNGDFSQGLAGWSTDPSNAVTADNGVASLQIQPYADNVFYISLYQQVSMSANVSYSISFDVNFLNGTTRPVDLLGQPNYLQASLVGDAAGQTTLLAYDKNGVYDDANNPISDAASGNWYHFAQNISFLTDWSGLLEFDLFDRGDEYLSIGQVKSVDIVENQTTPVPEPSTLLLFGVGLVAVLFSVFRKAGC